MKLVQKENFKAIIKPMIKNFQNELYQLENKRAKGAKLRANIRQELEREKGSKTFFRVLERQNMQIHTIFELYTDDNKSKYSNDIIKSAKKYEKLYTKQTSAAATTEFLSKIPNMKKMFNERFNLCEAEISLDEIIKSINSETNKNSPGNDGLTAEFCKHFLNEVAPVQLDVYNSQGKFGTMGLASRIRIISAIYKEGYKKILQAIDPFHF